MVIMGLSGGLGNQMFQYALGRHLAHCRGDKLFLYTYMLDKAATPRSYSLGHFSIYGQIISSPAQLCTLQTEMNQLWTVREFDSAYDPGLLEVKHEHILLWGSWQSELYFRGIRHLLLKDFSSAFSAPIFGFANYLFNKPAIKGPTVSVHIRRTDYLVKDDIRGTLDMHYYSDAFALCRRLLGKPQFMVFSDDIAWCMHALASEDGCHFCSDVAPTNSSDQRDFRRMLGCDHFIIANSSFSWWAAWLGSKINSIVIAPRKWYRHESAVIIDNGYTLRFHSDGIVPKKWIRL